MMESTGKSDIDTRGQWVMLGRNAMLAPAPFVSIIIVCRNPGNRLHVALGSVWMQLEASYELIVIDGASTDGTREWLATQHTRLTTLISEPDRGVYDAMNKGVAAARGTWVLFLGADDRLASADVVWRAAEHLSRTDAGVAVGAATYDDGRIYRLATRPRVVRRNFVHHQAAFYRRSLFADTGRFELRWQLMADYDFNLRLWRQGVRFESLPLPVAQCASGGLSDAGAWRGYREEIAVRHRHFGVWRCWLWDVGSLVRYGRKKIIRRTR